LTDKLGGSSYQLPLPLDPAATSTLPAAITLYFISSFPLLRHPDPAHHLDFSSHHLPAAPSFIPVYTRLRFAKPTAAQPIAIECVAMSPDSSLAAAILQSL
jgi:hypothetical protein